MGGNVVGSILGGISIYKKSAQFFLVLGVVVVIAGLMFKDKLNAVSVNNQNLTSLEFNLNTNGEVYIENSKVNFEQFETSSSYRYRYQVINNPTNQIEQLNVVVVLPKEGTEQTIGHRVVTNGSVVRSYSELINSKAILFFASGISANSQIAIEFEVPKNFITKRASEQFFSKIPSEIWLAISVALPVITLLTLLLIALKRSRKVSASKTPQTSLPSRLSPAMVGVLLRGKISSRELSATIFHLAYRGHLIIRQVRREEFRFRRKNNSGALLDYEEVLLDQVFGRGGEVATTEEVNLSLSQEVFSKRISQAFLLAYKKVNELGYFVTNPLTLHRRYQTAGVIMTVLGLVGLIINLLFIDNAYSIFLWGAMIFSAVLVFIYSKGMPVRTIYGDRELAKWLAFKNYLSSSEPINYTARGQDLYLAYLPYAIIFECEQEWTRRFYSLPFAAPQWYLAENIITIDKFANSIFPIFGYLSHALYISSEPSSR